MKYRAILVLILISQTLCAKEVPVETAKRAAVNFLTSGAVSNLKNTATPVLTLLDYEPDAPFQGTLKNTDEKKHALYIFSVNNNDGFVIISGDDLATPVLGYSLENSFPVENMPRNLRKWLEGYKDQIRYLQTIGTGSSLEVNPLWEQILSGTYSTLKSSSSVAPLVSTQWDQRPYYNDLCPYDYDAGDRTVTGCAATAMAQIMKYWNYPSTGTGFHSYNHDEYGTLSANFGGTTYNWGAMPNKVSSANPAVATLMYHCGVSIDMSYGVASEGGSGAYIITDRSPLENCVEFALKEYFNYDNSLHGVIRDNYSDASWISLLKGELDAGRPIEYAGFGSGGGHAFVCDGYDNNDFFHFNWGWSGYYDGYFSIDALDPSGTGTGGGSGGYNSGQQALIGIRPPDGQADYELVLYDALTISENPLFFTKYFTMHTDFANYGTGTFTGDLSVAIFDEDLNFVEFAEVLEGASLSGGMHYTSGLDFSNPGSLNMLPGKYYASAVYRSTGGNWVFAGDGSYNNILEFEVYYASDIELYSEFTISSGATITMDEAFTVTVDVLNNSASTFNGDFEIELFDMEGNYAATIQTLTGAALESGYYYDDVVFTSGGISIEPGTYLLALLHKPDGGDWTLSGSSFFTNPVKVIVKEAPLQPDRYENNDDENSPYMLTLDFVSDLAGTTTAGSNVHIGTDIDYYRISLEPGYNYSINARLHDSYNSDVQEIFTLDALWAFNAHGYWSEIYDDVMPGSIDLAGGGEVTFGIAPFFEGEMGTYLFEIEASRTEILSAIDQSEELVRVFPNPASDKIYISGTEEIEFIRIFDVRGKEILSLIPGTYSAEPDIEKLEAGVYFIHIQQKNNHTIHKIIKQ